VERKADLRAFVLSGEEPVVWKSGLLFTIREYPLVDEGSLMGRILVRGGGAR